MWLNATAAFGTRPSLQHDRFVGGSGCSYPANENDGLRQIRAGRCLSGPANKAAAGDRGSDVERCPANVISRTGAGLEPLQNQNVLFIHEICNLGCKVAPQATGIVHVRARCQKTIVSEL